MKHDQILDWLRRDLEDRLRSNNGALHGLPTIDNIYNKFVYLTNTFISIILCIYIQTPSRQKTDVSINLLSSSFRVSVRLSISVCLPCHQFLFAVKNGVECNRRMMGPWIWNLPIRMTFPFELCQDVGAKDQESPLNKQQASKTFWGIRHPSHHWIMVINSEQSIKPFPLCGMHTVHSSTANQSVAVCRDRGNTDPESVPSMLNSYSDTISPVLFLVVLINI